MVSQSENIKRVMANFARMVKCKVCSREFLTRHTQGRYCSKSCSREGARESWRDYGMRNKERRSVYHKNYYEKNKALIIKRTSEYQKTMFGKLASKKSHQWQKEKYPHKIFARHVVRAAILAGYLIKKPCSVCGEIKSEAHHENYMYPFRVKWVCRKHHDEIHRLKKEGDA